MVETRRLSELRSRSAGLLRLPGGDLVIALSGGADSATLAYLLSHLGRRSRAVHVNHGRPASARLEDAARAVAEAVGIELEVIPIVVPPGASFEGQARGARYQALFGSLRPDETLLTAHTLDDQAETVLMNLLRGSGPAGLAGITPRTDALARPMLAVGRSETRELAALATLPFFDDPSNLDHGFRRNSIRLEVIPDLSARFNPRLIEALARTAELVGADESFLQGEADKVPVIGEGGRLAVSLGSLLAVARPVADRALRGLLARLRPPHRGNAAELEEIWSVVTRRRKSAMLSGGIEVTHEGPLLVLRSPSPAASPPGSVALEVGANQVGPFQVVVERSERVCRAAPIGLWAALFPATVALDAQVDEKGRLVVTADEETAWVAGERRLPVAWYQPGTSGYLSVFAREGSG
ncbi:MAG TPA: tRNA lysidine(34) synthetase TilS, partial [Acidimicrobiia bacterium]|nr:tRNA lysidine(34) synthetase TilS [Acidimicrobiia bacterium]